MGSHLTAIGFSRSFTLEEQLDQLAQAAHELGRNENGSIGVLVHQDTSGSRVTLTLEQGSITCLTPAFRPGQRLRVLVHRFQPNECRYERPLMVDLLDADREQLYPLAVQIEDLAVSEDRFRGGDIVDIEIAALAEEIEVFPNEEAFRSTGSPMATQSVIPSGLFSLGTDSDDTSFEVSPRMLMTGEVVSAEFRRHSLFGGQFVRLTVASYGGSFEVLADASDLLTDAGPVLPPLGAVVRGQFWLSGRLMSDVTS